MLQRLARAQIGKGILCLWELPATSVTMNRKLRIALLAFGAILLIALVLFCPYNAGSVPEWKLQVVDQTGKPLAGAQVEQEWLDPISEGQTMVESRNTDADGWVLFPKRPIHNQLASGSLKFKPSAHIYMCWQDQSGQVLYGQLFYEGERSELADHLVLAKGTGCPFS